MWEDVQIHFALVSMCVVFSSKHHYVPVWIHNDSVDIVQYVLLSGLTVYIYNKT